MVGGFGMSGQPSGLIDALLTSGRRRLTIVSNNLGEPGLGLGAMLRTGQVARAVGSYFTPNPEVSIAVDAGALEVTLLPQGTLAEAIRAGGAGLGGFFTPTAVGTLLATGKETRVIGGRTYLFEPALRADVALVRAWRGDTLGNLMYRKTARNFNPLMAMAADLVIAEVDQLVAVGSLDPEQIVTPHALVDLLVVTSSVKPG